MACGAANLGAKQVVQYRADYIPDDGSPVFGTRTVNLKPKARELMAETRYSTRLSAASTLTAVAAYRQHPDNDANAAGQFAMGVRYQLSF